jgi:hypothetical protein
MAKISATFRVVGRDLVPDDISLLLGRKPDEAHRKGDPRLGESGRRYSDFNTGLWAIDTPKDEKPLDEHLGELLGKLEGYKSVMRNLQEKGYSLDIFVGVFGGANIEFAIPPDILRKLGNLNLKLIIDVYSCE